MDYSLSEIAGRVAGTVVGPGERRIRGVAPFETAGEGDITLAASPGCLRRLGASAAAAFIVPRPAPAAPGRALVAVDNPMLAFARVIRLFHPQTPAPAGIHPLACVAPDLCGGEEAAIGPFAVVGRGVTLGRRVAIGAGVFIGAEAVIGDDVVLHPHVVVGERCRIGSRVVVHAGTVIGSDGFGFVADGGVHHKIPQVGIVQIDDDVEIGAGNTIDRATFGRTWIGQGVKTDNLVHIAHNVTIGAHTVIVAQVGISGSVTIGRHVILAGQAGVADHLAIGDGAVVGPAAGVAKSVAAGEVVLGVPALPRRQHLRIQAVAARLPEMKKRIEALEKRLSGGAAAPRRGNTGGDDGAPL
jgi:UDP-3-O-[3-hydroxymyristoyl] glucosamine N-acyltransferase